MKINYSFLLILICIVGISCENSKPAETTSDPQNTDSTSIEHSIDPSPNSDSTIIKDSISLVNDEIDSTNLTVEEDSMQSNLNTLDSSSLALIPKGLRDTDLFDFTLIPSERELGIANYPGSLVIYMGDPITYNNRTYCTMELVSSAQPEDITKFYKDRKENWLYVEQNNVHTFKQDEDAYFRATNNLQIKPYDPDKYPNIDTLLSFKPVSTIFIYYEVKNSKTTAMLN